MLKNLDEYLEVQAERKQVVGSWGFNSNLNFKSMRPEETNVWFFEQIFNFLRSFFGLVMPDSLEVTTHNATQQIKRENLDQQTFLDELMLVMKKVKEPLWTIRVNLNIVGFLRTDNNPASQVRLQIKEPCSFIVWGGPDETGFQSFSITYNLFSKTKLEGQNQMLWSINQPLLEKGLKKWEKQTGRNIDTVDTNSGSVPMERYGFAEPGTEGVALGDQGLKNSGGDSDPFNFDDDFNFDFDEGIGDIKDIGDSGDVSEKIAGEKSRKKTVDSDKVDSDEKDPFSYL